MSASTIAANDVSYCVVSTDTLETTAKIRAWIAARESEGWIVEFTVRQDSSGKVGVMWQCITNLRNPYQEFTPCISMAGREFEMN